MIGVDLNGFTVICQTCKGEAEVDFYKGYIHSNGGDVGHLIISCHKCGTKAEIDDE